MNHHTRTPFNNSYFSVNYLSLILKSDIMNQIAEFLLKHMDRLRDIFEWIDSYIDTALMYLGQAKKWLEKILHYIEQALNTLSEATGAKRADLRHTEEHLFV